MKHISLKSFKILDIGLWDISFFFFIFFVFIFWFKIIKGDFLLWDFLKFDLDLYKLPPNTHLTNCPLSRLSTYLFSYFPTLPLSHLSSCPFGHLPTCLLLGLTRPSFALLTSSQLWTVKIMRVQGEIYQSHINCQS